MPVAFPDGQAEMVFSIARRPSITFSVNLRESYKTNLVIAYWFAIEAA